MEFTTLKELVDELRRSDKLKGGKFMLDNDQAYFYIESDSHAQCVLDMDPSELLEQALDLLGVPHRRS